ncbi:PLD nuclease N-terminal domain-containing protein [Bacillus safensis]|uniref:PLD nuclease N-terminal domain-containing protein n=1 Tax=Bacillus safensis TaxID=561879 RepID=UPI002342CEB6|nr:PLD nuclease N-terminal domain-containing protein [Bacillus safensis]WCL57383.1 PLD nuclease N-terminal domain-containing protein [Bacillus safensis]
MDVKMILPLILLQAILMVIGLFDLLKRDPSRIRGEVKWIWALMIVFVASVGPIVYLIFGRKSS